MNETLQNWLNRAGQWLGELSTFQKIGLAVMMGVLITGAIVGTALMRRDPYQVLYTDLQAEDATAVSKRLGEQNIPFQISENHSTISVPKSKIYVARMELAKSGLPGHDVVGFEKFDSSTIGMSSYVQRIQYVRAVQGELIRSIQRLAAVKNARVHISIPPKKTFLEEEQPPKASVILELRPGQAPSKAEVTGIAHLVASAVEGLRVNQVTIVDTQGNFLHRPDEGGNAAVSSNLIELQRGIEKDYERRIEDLLVPVVGLGKVRARVTAEMDPARVNTMEETYDPDRAVVKNTIKNDEVSSGSRPNPIGIPGSRSNLPGTETQNPPVPMANTSTEKNMQNLSYAIPKKVQTVDKPSGSIKRLSVAVVVDGYYAKGAAGETFTPRTEEELKRLQDIVANAVGYDVERRDSINVSSLPFKETEIAPEANAPASPFSLQELMPTLIKNGALALVFILFSFLVLRPILRHLAGAGAEKQMKTLPKTVAELEAARRDQGILSLSEAVAALEQSEPVEKKEEQELQKRILERLEKAPRKGIRIVQEWLEEDALLPAAPQAA